MDPEDLDNTDGKDYACETRLLSGIFGVHFEASDGVLLNRTPVVENMTVTNRRIFSLENTIFVDTFYAGQGELRINSIDFASHPPNPGMVMVSRNEFEINTSRIDALWWANISYNLSGPPLTKVNRSTIMIYRYNFSTGNWTLGENPGLDLEKNFTWINVTSLSTFAVLAQPPLNKKPVARLGKDITIMEGETAMLNASGSFDPDNDSLTYHWDFGDSPGKAPVLGDKVAEHKYTKPGRYIVTVNVSDGRDNSTAQQTVTVKQKGSEQFVIVIVVIIVLVVAIIFMLPRGDDRKVARLKAEDDEFQKGMAVRKAKSKKAKGPPPDAKSAGEEE